MEASAKKYLRNKIVHLGAAVVGATVAYYSQLGWLIPLVPTVIIWWGGSKLLSKPTNSFLPVFAVQIGHTLGFVSTAILFRSLSPVDIVEAFILVGSAAWLLWRPGVVPSVVVGLVQALSLAVNLFALSSFAIGSTEHRALTVIIVWHLAALFLLWEGYATLRKTSKFKESANAA